MEHGAAALARQSVLGHLVCLYSQALECGFHTNNHKGRAALALRDQSLEPRGKVPREHSVAERGCALSARLPVTGSPNGLTAR